MATEITRGNISVLGVGSMGGALATWFLDRGHHVTVWNRTPGRSRELERKGAHVATNARHALAASPLSFAVVDSCATVNKWFESYGVSSGTTLVNVTTTTPSQAEGLSQTLRAKGTDFLDAAFFFYPDSVGKADSTARFSGSRAAWDAHRDVFDSLGSDIEFLDGPPGLASVVDAAWISFYVPALTAFLESVAFVMSHDLPYCSARDALFSAMPVLEGFIKGLTTFETQEFDSPNPVDLYINSLTTAIAPIRGRGLPAAIGNAAVHLLESLPASDRRTADISVLVHNLLDAGSASAALEAADI